MIAGLIAALIATALTALPAFAHPAECVITDDAALDADCEAGKDGAGEVQGIDHSELDDVDLILGRGANGLFDRTSNLHPIGFSARTVPFSGPGSGVFNSDLAFSGDWAIQGTYSGFRIIDVSEPGAPVELINYEECVSPTSANGSQGDVVVWGDILVRSWDAPRNATQARTCGDTVVPAGQEGVHVFDISDPTDPQVLAFVATPCGSHTASGVPDLANDRLLIYNSPSSNAANCRGIDILEVPLSDPAGASYLRFLASGTPAPLPFQVVVEAPSSAAGTYQATGAAFGPSADATGISGTFEVVSSAVDVVAGEGCGPLDGFTAGAIAIASRGTCPFVDKAANAQAAGASALVVANNVAGAPITVGGTDPSITIPVVMISLADANTLRAGLPATGTVNAAPQPVAPERACHDTGVILGDALKAACAGGNGVSVWSMDPTDGGSLANPVLLYSRTFAGVTIGHSAAFTWDGEVLVFGHEPGGGGQAQCQATSSEVNRTLFFLDAASGDTIGTFLHPRPQGSTENCTWHNYNVVPTDKSYVMVSGSYQAGISVVDFTDPSAPREIAFADPPPLSETSLVLGGDWSTYWYNGFIYQSDIRRGLIIWKLSDPAVAGARNFDHLNPQTQETTFALKAPAQRHNR